MQRKNKVILTSLPIWAILLATLLFVALTEERATASVANFIAPRWTYNLPADNCYGQQHSDCHFSPPVIADIDGDSYPDIVAATNKGVVTVLRQDGTLIWSFDTAPAFGMSPGKQEIHAGPAVADIDRDGHVEIVIGTGTIDWAVCTQGGLIVLSHQGQVEPGWPFFAHDGAIPPMGCADTVFGTPAIGDMDNDGDLEIVTMGFDKRIRIFHHNGVQMPGFPIDSYLSRRFPTWEDLRGKLADDTWASPTLVDLDGDGYLDILMSTAEGNFDDSWPGDANGWNCPFELHPMWAPGYCGGALYAVNRFGRILPGFPFYIMEDLQSSPAVADTNGDGIEEIFVGTGDFYYVTSPDHPTYGFRVYGLDLQGNPLPGWEGGKPTGSPMSSSPAIGNITGDSRPEIVISGKDGKIYAFYYDGRTVPGFPMTPRDHFSKPHYGFDVGQAAILADFNGDGDMEIIINLISSVAVIDGDGQQITSSDHNRHPGPVFAANGNLLNSAVVGDIDKDGHLELVSHDSILAVWDLDNSSVLADWPMFKHDPARTGNDSRAWVSVTPNRILIFHQKDNPGDATKEITVFNPNDNQIQWSASTPPGLSLSSYSGTINPHQRRELTLSVPTSGKEVGQHNLGKIVITVTIDDGEVRNSPSEIDVTLFIGDIFHAFMPVVIRK